MVTTTGRALTSSVSASEYLKSNGASLKFCCDDVRRDRDAVLTAVRQSGASFEYAHESLKRDRDFVLEAFAVASSPETADVIKFAHETLRCDPEFWLTVVMKRGIALRADDSLRRDEDAVLAAASIWASIVSKFADESLKRDREFMRAVMSKAMEAIGVNCVSLTEVMYKKLFAFTDEMIKAIVASYPMLTSLNVWGCTNLSRSRLSPQTVRC